MKITHRGIYEINKIGLFNNVNKFSDVDKVIEAAINPYKGVNEEKYNHISCTAWECFTMFFFIKFNNIGLLGVKDIQDTSGDPYNYGYDFSYTSLFGQRGFIQSKWRSNALHQFKLGELSTASEIAYSEGVSSENNILFINIDDSDNLFDWRYKFARKNFRVIGRKTIIDWIELHPEFWNEFRTCIRISAQNFFIDPPKNRDVQDWIIYGNKDRNFPGTCKVIDGTFNKGRVDATTATGKSLCIYHNIKDSFKIGGLNNLGRDLVVLWIPWRALITQTFVDLYKYKLFGYTDNANNVHNSNISCIITMSGEIPNYNPLVADIKAGYEFLNPDVIVGQIMTNLALGKKTLLIITKKSYDQKYSSIFNSLKQKGMKKEQIFEIVDEYHNLIPSSGVRAEHENLARYLESSDERNSGVIFYSASNKSGTIVSSDFEHQFGPLLAKVTRNDLRIRGYVCPKLLFKILKVKPLPIDRDTVDDAVNKNLNIYKAQTESVGLITAFNDLKNYYPEPNLITFGSHVPGCHFIATNLDIQTQLPDVTFHVMDADTKNSDRQLIFDTIKDSGNNILNQHSVAKEGVNIPSMHGGLIGRGMEFKDAQQAIGRSDRALYEDTINFELGKIDLDSPIGWKKYWNIIYLVVEEGDDTSLENRLTDLIRYLLENGIPKEEWDFSAILDQERVAVDNDYVDVSPLVYKNINLDNKRLQRMIDSIEIRVFGELQDEKERISREKILNQVTDEDRKHWRLFGYGQDLISFMKDKLNANL